MPFLTDEEIESKLNSPDNLVNRLTLHTIQRGRPEGASNIPMEIRKVVTVLTNEGESSSSVAKAFNIGESVVQRASQGYVTERQENNELKDVIDRIKSKKRDAESQAIDKVLETLNILTPEKLSSVSKVKDISSIAKDMAVIANQLSDKGSNDGEVGVHLHLYAPKSKSLDDYDIIDV